MSHSEGSNGLERVIYIMLVKKKSASNYLGVTALLYSLKKSSTVSLCRKTKQNKIVFLISHILARNPSILYISFPCSDKCLGLRAILHKSVSE